MQTEDIQRLARQFMEKAVRVAPGDNIWVENVGPKAKVLADACSAEVLRLGGIPHPIDSGSAVLNATVPNMSEADMIAAGEEALAKMKTMQGYIRLRDDNDLSRTTVSPEQLTRHRALVQHDMTEYRVRNTRWVIASTPTVEFAKACGMSAKEFDKFYLDVCLLDYSRMTGAAEPLKQLLAQGSDVKIIGRDTSLTFSIKDIGAKACTGILNIPDGECFTAPVKDSINGHIAFGKSNYQGQTFQSIDLDIEQGRIVEAIAENDERTKALNQILDADEGARYCGEFAVAFNPKVMHPVGDILFDEKINGSLHMAWGQCYEDHANNGNKSANHWDMVHIQRADYGGGEIWIDGRLIRKDGIFVVPELAPLNPDNLLKLAP